jgi:hypothetical protein
VQIAAQAFEGRDGERRVGELEVAEQRQAQRRPRAVGGLDGQHLALQVLRYAPDGRAFLRAHQRRAGGAGLLFDDPHDGGGAACHDDGPAGLDDAGLFARDLFERGAEKRRVLHADFGDHGHLRHDDVGAVEASAHAGLEHGELDLLLQEPLQGDRGGQLEEGAQAPAGLGGLALVGAFDFVQQAQEILVGDHGARDADAFVEADEMGAGVERGAHAGGAQDGFQHGGDGALAVGAGDVHAGQPQGSTSMARMSARVVSRPSLTALPPIRLYR